MNLDFITPIANLLDSFIYTDEERIRDELKRKQIEAQLKAIEAQKEMAEEQTRLRAAQAAQMARAITVAGVVVAGGLVLAVLLWR
jgi:F0F1-type ATP synthase assembly protein I